MAKFPYRVDLISAAAANYRNATNKSDRPQSGASISIKQTAGKQNRAHIHAYTGAQMHSAHRDTMHMDITMV